MTIVLKLKQFEFYDSSVFAFLYTMIDANRKQFAPPDKLSPYNP